MRKLWIFRCLAKPPALRSLRVGATPDETANQVDYDIIVNKLLAAQESMEQLASYLDSRGKEIRDLKERLAIAESRAVTWQCRFERLREALRN